MTPERLTSEEEASIRKRHGIAASVSDPSRGMTNTVDWYALDVGRLLGEVARLRPAWTREAPTVPGWYWWRCVPSSEPSLEHLTPFAGEMCLANGSPVSELSGFWSGPLVPPTGGTP